MTQTVVANKASNILPLLPTNDTFDSHKLYLPSNTRLKDTLSNLFTQLAFVGHAVLTELTH